MTLPHKTHAKELSIPFDDTDNFFHSTDLGLCAALVTQNFELVALDKTNRKAVFIFSRKKGLDDVVEKYWSADGLQVDSRKYFDNLRFVKNRLYAA